MAFFSIVIPTYNSSLTVERCLNSIAQQVFNDIEVLIVDGASTDSTISIVQSFYNRLQSIDVTSEADNGPYDAMNRGINRASGQWIMFLGSDDALHDKFVLQRLKKICDSHSADVVYGNAYISGNPGWAKDSQVYDGEYDLNKLLKKNICHQAIVYKHSFIKDSVGYYNISYTVCADWDLNLRCWAKGTFLYTPTIISIFSAGGISSTNSSDPTFAEDFTGNVLRYFSGESMTELLHRPGSISNRPLSKPPHRPGFAFLTKVKNIISQRRK